MRCSVVAVCLVLLVAAVASPAERIFPYAYDKHILANGLTVVMIPMPSPGLVSYFTVVRTGSRDEVDAGRSGFAHFFEHMMFRGTKKYPGPMYDHIVTSIGARENASTTDDFTMYYLTFVKDDLERVIEIESDRFQNLSYEKPAFQTEAGAVYGEYRIGKTQPTHVLQERIQELAYDAHPYKHTTIGFEADIKAMPEAYQYSLDFYRRFYRPDNVVLLIAGDIDPKATLGLIEKYYGPWQKGYEPSKIPAEPPQTAERKAEVSFPGRTLPILVVSYKGDAFDPANRDYVAARLLGEMAFGPQSELYKKLVLEDRVVQSLSCDIAMNRDPSLFDIGAMVKKAEDIETVRDAIYRTIEQFKTQPADARKLDELKRHIRYSFLMSLDSPDKVAGALSRFAALTGGIEAVDDYYAACDKVTPQDIMHAAAKYFVPERRTVVVLKGVEEKEKSKESGNGNVSGKQKKERSGEVKTPFSRDPKGSAPATPQSSAPKTELPQNQTILLPVATDPAVAIRVWFKVGSQDDPPGKEGVAAITAAMLTDASTKNRPYNEILDKLFPLAAHYSSSSGVEMTVVAGRVHKDNAAPFCPLLLEAILAPAFQQDDFDRIKSQTLNYLENSLRYSSDEELGKAVLYNTIFAGTPYGHLPAGTIDSVRGLTLDDVRAFYRKHYVRENVVLGLGGGFDPATEETLRRGLAELSTGSAAASPPPQPAPIHGRQVTIVEKDASATAISIGFPIDVHRGSKDWYALALANSWFGQHRNSSSHLYQVIREARGLNYGDYSYIEHFPGAAGLQTPPVGACRRQQIFEIWIRPVPNAARHFALRAALGELQKLVDHGMTEEEFKITRDFLRKFVLQLAPTTMDRLGYVMDDRFYGVTGGHLANFHRAMDELTLADVNAAVKKHLQYDNLEIVFVTKDGASLMESLTTDAPSPITYTTPKPESVLAEDAKISTMPLRIKAADVKIVPLGELFVK